MLLLMLIAVVPLPEAVMPLAVVPVGAIEKALASVLMVIAPVPVNEMPAVFAVEGAILAVRL
jgi:hypothetical protein